MPFMAPSGFLRLGYVEWGPERGPAVLCAHGLTRNARDFDTLAQRLARGGRRVVCVDYPGRGRSDRLARAADYNYPVYLAAIAALIARLDVGELDWVGTSMGGLTGMLMAAQPGAPIRRMVINDIGPFLPKAAIERIATYVGTQTKFESVDAVEAYLRRVSAPFGPLTDAQWRHLAVHSSRREGAGVELHYDPAIGDAFRATPAADIDLWSYWDRVTCPTLVLRGVNSDLLLPETAREMTMRGPRAELAEIAQCGHAPALMADDQIAVVDAFLSDARPR
jgi:pimeloyl-ACP methyl ester carboxylesterase